MVFIESAIMGVIVGVPLFFIWQKKRWPHTAMVYEKRHNTFVPTLTKFRLITDRKTRRVYWRLKKFKKNITPKKFENVLSKQDKNAFVSLVKVGHDDFRITKINGDNIEVDENYEAAKHEFVINTRISMEKWKKNSFLIENLPLISLIIVAVMFTIMSWGTAQYFSEIGGRFDGIASALDQVVKALTGASQNIVPP